MDQPSTKFLLVGGARPNFMKVAPIVHSLEQYAQELSYKLVHTGQHYDYAMSEVFFQELEIPEPDYFLESGSGSHAEQTAKVMVEFEKVCAEEEPDCVLVVGDVNSTLACSVTAKKLGVQVAHVEAGLRSGDMAMPEEINRMVTDSISDFLFATEKSGIENLRAEGRSEADLFFVGNIVIDTLHHQLERLPPLKDSENPPVDASLLAGPFAAATLHRPSNVDSRNTLQGILEGLSEIGKEMPVIFPLHPRTRARIEEFELQGLLQQGTIHTLPALPYRDFLNIWKRASLVLTDSGGLQEETTALGVPCLTIRENTERPVTIQEGTNTLVGTSREGILSAYEAFKADGSKQGRIPELWDGRTAERIVSILRERLHTSRQAHGIEE